MFTEGRKLISTAKIVHSLFKPSTITHSDERRRIYRETLTKKPALPINEEEDILHSFAKIIQARKIPGQKIKYKYPYWIHTDKPYDPIDIFNATVQFSDDHQESPSPTVFPPAKDVQNFANLVMNSKNSRVTTAEQLVHLLDITENNVVGAANLGFVACRFFCRGSDMSAYPTIDYSFETMKAWNAKIAQFEVYNEQLTHSGADNYYFWTHMFVALATQIDNSLWGTALNVAFSKGTEIMVWTRKNIVHKPTTTAHREASIIGRNVGFAIADMLNLGKEKV